MANKNHGMGAGTSTLFIRDSLKGIFIPFFCRDCLFLTLHDDVLLHTFMLGGKGELRVGLDS